MAAPAAPVLLLGRHGRVGGRARHPGELGGHELGELLEVDETVAVEVGLGDHGAHLESWGQRSDKTGTIEKPFLINFGTELLVHGKCRYVIVSLN